MQNTLNNCGTDTTTSSSITDCINKTVSRTKRPSIRNDLIYNPGFKVKVLEWAQNNSVHAASVKYKVSRIFIRQWLLHESAIRLSQSDSERDRDLVLTALMDDTRSSSSTTGRLPTNLHSISNNAVDVNNNNTGEANETEFICHVTGCGRRFRSREGLERHQALHVPDAKRFVCNFPTCTKAFRQSSGLSRHKKVHAMQDFACDQCSETFRTQVKLDFHIRRKHFTPCYPCPVPGCTKVFMEANGVSHHCSTRHSHDRQEEPLPSSSTSSSSSANGTDDGATASNAAKKNGAKIESAVRFQCQHCPKSYKSKSYLKTHVQKKHG